MNDFIKELSWRGFLHTVTPGVEEHLSKDRTTAYVGFDPTASSLHVGSMLPIMGLVHFQKAGHIPVAIAGGGTGMVGDPSGKTQERKLLTLEELEFNLAGIKKQLSQFLDFNAKDNPAVLVNNADWLSKLPLMEFLRDIGKYFSVNEMLAKESVRARIEQQRGMSFTEFSYSLLQSYDYLQLYDRYHCTLQMGGSDQWGNITSGIDLIRRLRSAEAHAIVFPLITTSAGTKFGKSESGTVWLDPERTSPYRFYQYWINTDDRDAIKYLKYFTLLPESIIDELQKVHKSSPEKREAQTALAKEVTLMLHGESELQKAMKATRMFFGGEISDVDEKVLLEIFIDVPSTEIPKNLLSGPGIGLIDLMVASGMTKSKGEARKMIQGGGAYVNNVRISEVDKKYTINDLLYGKFLILRKGTRNYWLIRIVDKI